MEISEDKWKLGTNIGKLITDRHWDLVEKRADLYEKVKRRGLLLKRDLKKQVIKQEKEDKQSLGTPDTHGQLPIHHVLNLTTANKRNPLTKRALEAVVKLNPLSLAHKDHEGYTPLHILLGRKIPSTTIVDTVIKMYPEALSITDNYGRTPLFLMVQNHIVQDKKDKEIPLFQFLLGVDELLRKEDTVKAVTMACGPSTQFASPQNAQLIKGNELAFPQLYKAPANHRVPLYMIWHHAVGAKTELWRPYGGQGQKTNKMKVAIRFLKYAYLQKMNGHTKSNPGRMRGRARRASSAEEDSVLMRMLLKGSDKNYSSNSSVASAPFGSVKKNSQAEPFYDSAISPSEFEEDPKPMTDGEIETMRRKENKDSLKASGTGSDAEVTLPQRSNSLENPIESVKQMFGLRSSGTDDDSEASSDSSVSDLSSSIAASSLQNSSKGRTSYSSKKNDRDDPVSAGFTFGRPFSAGVSQQVYDLGQSTVDTKFRLVHAIVSLHNYLPCKDILDIVLEHCKADLEKREECSGFIPLHIAIVEKAPSDVIQLLLKTNKETAKFQTQQERYPYHLAMAYGLDSKSTELIRNAYPDVENFKDPLNESVFSPPPKEWGDNKNFQDEDVEDGYEADIADRKLFKISEDVLAMT